MLRQSLDALARFSPRFRRVMMRSWYEALVVIDRRKQITFMNYGYADLEPLKDSLTLDKADETNRYAIQMYHHVANGIDLRDKDVVEVGSGRGGGAAYVNRTFNPGSMLGVDISKNAVDFCNKYYSDKHLSFAHGDAENIPLADRAVDVVINVESSHCYGSIEQFLAEVNRILKPGGYFLFADHRDDHQIDLLRQQLRQGGFTIVTETDITANVVNALRLDDDRRRELIGSSCPQLLRREAEEFAALVGTRAYESFRTNTSRYLSFVLAK